MIDRTNIANLSGAEVIDMNGKKVGKVGQVYVDEQDGTPNWLTVNTGLFGMSETFVPIDRATWDGEAVTVPYEKDFTKDAPRIDGDGRISPAEEEQLYRYYGMSDSTAPTGTAPTGTAPTGHDASGPDTDTDTTVTRSEEQLTVGTEQVETGKARLRKYVVTEEQNVTVPVAHEEVHLEREPISEQNAGRGTSGADIGEEDVEVTLHAERPVVDKETVAVEQVRVDVETVTDQERVSEEVRKERVELDDGTSTERPST